MSRVMLIAADKPLPLCDKRVERTHTFTMNGREYTITAQGGFCVSEHIYYRDAVDMLGHTMKPYQYELNIETQADDLADFRTYLEEQLAPGEEVELWNLWIGFEPGPMSGFKGKLKDFDLDTLKQFDQPFGYINSPGQCRMTITI